MKNHEQEYFVVPHPFRMQRCLMDCYWLWSCASILIVLQTCTFRCTFLHDFANRLIKLRAAPQTPQQRLAQNSIALTVCAAKAVYTMLRAELYKTSATQLRATTQQCNGCGRHAIAGNYMLYTYKCIHTNMCVLLCSRTRHQCPLAMLVSNFCDVQKTCVAVS